MIRTFSYILMMGSLFILSACACADSAAGPESYLARKGLSLPDKTFVQHCHGYGCKTIDRIELSKADWKHLGKVFKPKARDAQAERAKIAEAIGLWERKVGALNGTDEDIHGTFMKLGANQLDCVDESTNTTIYMLAMKEEGLIRFHDILAPTARMPIIHAGRWPHQTAVIREGENGALYAVDSWFHDNGAAAEIVPLEVWKSGWKPEQNDTQDGAP